MTDDDEEGFEPEASADDANDPAAAFEGLRRTIEKQGAQIGAEMTVIRKGVEAAFEQFERFQQPTDYGPDLGRVVQQLGGVGERLKAVEQSPILRNGPEHYARALERGGDSLVRSAAQQLERQATDLERSANSLARRLASARERHVQDRLLWIVGIVGVLAGIFLILLLPRFLPFAADSRVASFVMGNDRGSAGRAMIEAADPKRYQGILKAEWVYGTNREALDKCITDMFETRKEQRCALILPVIESGSRK